MEQQGKLERMRASDMSVRKRPHSSRIDDNNKKRTTRFTINPIHIVGRSSSTKCPQSSPLEHKQAAVNPDIWQTLPLDIVEEIVLKLPLASRVRAQTLNKRFRSLIIRNEETAKNTPETPWLVSCVGNLTGNERAFFDPEHNKWRFINKAVFGNENPVIGGAPGGGISVIDKDRQILSVINPLSTDNASAIDLPVFPGTMFFCTFDVNSNSATDYTALAFGAEDYDSEEGVFAMYRPSFGEFEWRELRSSAFFMRRKDVTIVDSLFFGNWFCFLTAQPKSSWAHECWSLETRRTLLYVFNLETTKWNCHTGLEMPSLLHKLKTSPVLYLVQYNGSLMMVVRESSFLSKKMRVWMFVLDFKDWKWREVRSIPGHILFLSRMGSTSAATTGRGNLIYFAQRRGMSGVAIYDLSTHCMQELPCAAAPCPFESLSYSLAPCEGIWFHPQLN